MWKVLSEVLPLLFLVIFVSVLFVYMVPDKKEESVKEKKVLGTVEELEQDAVKAAEARF